MGISDLFNDPEENCFLTQDPQVSDGYYVFTGFSQLQTHDYAWFAAGILTAFSVGISMWLIYMHAKNFTNANHQRFIIRILLMVPVYAIDSFLSFRFYWIAIYFDLIRDTYEAFVIDTFFSLMIEYTGGYSGAKQLFVEKGEIKMILPLCCVNVRQPKGLLRSLKRTTLQYVVIRPVCAIISVILVAFNVYCPGNWNFSRGYIYITFILFCSVTSAMYALVMYYATASKEMAPYKPVGKFLSVKFVIFMSFWQSIAVAGLVYLNVFQATSHWSTNDISNGIENFLVCVEMFIIAIVHIFVFSHKEYVVEGKKTGVLSTIAHAFNPRDVAGDIYYSFFPNSKAYRSTKAQQRLSELENDPNGAEMREVMAVSVAPDATLPTYSNEPVDEITPAPEYKTNASVSK